MLGIISVYFLYSFQYAFFTFLILVHVVFEKTKTNLMKWNTEANKQKLSFSNRKIVFYSGTYHIIHAIIDSW